MTATSQVAAPELRYGVLFSMQDPVGSAIGHPALYRNALDQVALAEEQGFDWVNVTEHHVAADGYLPALLVLLAGMAARTARIRLSTGMLVLPLHHPIRIAEEAAVLDNISNGRLTLGLAVGYREIEFAAFAADFDRRGPRMQESLEILRLAWSGLPFSYDGELFHIPEVVVRPVPVQRPGIPLWLGGTSDVALRRAVRGGSPCCPGAVHDMPFLQACMRRYDELRGEMAADSPRALVLPRVAVVGETTDEARRRAHPGIRAMLETYRSWGLPIDVEAVVADWDRLDDMVIVGDVDHCVAQLERYRDLGTTDLMLQFAIPGVAPAIARESQARFAARFLADHA